MPGSRRVERFQLTLPPGARDIRFTDPQVVGGTHKVLVSVHWNDSKGDHQTYIPLWSLQMDYGPEKLQPLLDLLHSGEDDDDQPPHKGNRIRKITDDDDSDNPPPPLTQPPPLSNEWVRIGPSKITGAVAGQVISGRGVAEADFVLLAAPSA
jgi:hypothetical protein